MRVLVLTLAVVLGCSPAARPSQSATPTTTATGGAESTQPSPAASVLPRDLSVVPAGDVRGDHALVGVFVDSGSNGGAANGVWDVPLDGGTPRSLVAYTRAERPLAGAFPFDIAKQLSPDGRNLVLSDAADVAGRGLAVVDLVAGTTRAIGTPDAADEPVWSLDGRRIAYRGYALQGPLQKESGLWVVDAAGGVPRQVWTSDRPAGSGATFIYGWTEDGSGLAVTRNYQDVEVFDIASGAFKQLSGPINGLAIRERRPSVVIARNQDVPLPSPTGPRGAPGNVGRPGEVEVRAAALGPGAIVYRHADLGTLLWSPRWSPTTNEVLFHWLCGAGASCRQELVVIDALTQAPRVLPTASAIYAISWSVDGTRILYSDINSVRVMSTDGAGEHELFRPVRTPTGQQPRISGIAAFMPR